MLKQKLNKFIGTLRSGEALKIKAMRGSFWLGAGSVMEQGLRFLRNMFLARLLAPEAFGIMAIVLAVNQAFETFAEIGIQTAIIHNSKGQERTYLNSAWWLAMGRATALYILAYLGAPWIAHFYHNPELVSLIRAAFLGVLFRGATSPGIYVAVKQMRFKPWVMAQYGGGPLGIAMTVLLAYLMRDVWALVIGFTLEAAVRCALSYCVCPFRPGLRFDRAHWQALLKYTSGIAGLPVLTFIFMRADIFVIGKLCPTAELGLYSMAAAIAHIPFQFLGAIIAPVAMPAFAEIQTDKARIHATLLKVTAMIAFATVPLLVCAALYGRDLLALAYGSPYAEVAGPFTIILGTSVLQTICVPIVTLYLAIGRPALHRLFVAIRTILILLLIYPAVKNFGLLGAAAAGLAAMALGYLVQIIWMRKLIGFDIRRYGAIFLQALGVSGCIVALWLITRGLVPARPFFNLLPGAVGCLLAYGLSLKIFLQSKTRFSC
jgi:O-antigen/teichoic acid export membrane protein